MISKPGGSRLARSPSRIATSESATWVPPWGEAAASCTSGFDAVKSLRDGSQVDFAFHTMRL